MAESCQVTDRMFFYCQIVSLCEIKEIRLGKKSKDFEKWAVETKKTDSNKCFVIFYGSSFRLKTLSFASIYFTIWNSSWDKKKTLVKVFALYDAALNSRDAEAWTRGLEYLINTHPINYLKKLDIWIQKEYELNQHCPKG